MPSDEFFNTGIVTYLWILNKNKPADRKDKVILINASDLWQPLKKNKGSKRKEMNAEHRARIVDALVRFENSDIAKVYDKWHFYFNKQQLQLTEVDEFGKYVSDSLGYYGEPYKLKDTEAVWGFFPGQWAWPVEDDATFPTDEIEKRGIAPNEITVFTKDYIYFTGKNRPGVFRINRKTDEQENLGMGVINVSFNHNKKTGKNTVTAKLVDKTYKDTEIVPYNPDPEQNEAAILAFMQKYITKPYQLLENTVGVEVNFNKEFYVPETVESVETILAEIAEIDRDLVKLQNELGL